jgi:putative oxidoreductase
MSRRSLSDSLSPSLGLFILRVGASSFMFFNHGLPKLLAFSEKLTKFSDPIGLGAPVSFSLVVFAEAVCSLLVAFGLMTRLAAIPLVIAMTVAGLVFHAADPFAKKELALLYGVVFLSIAFTGPGRWSIDHLLQVRGVRGWR